MGFFDKQNQSRKRNRKTKSPKQDKAKPPYTEIKLIPVADKYPPDTKEKIITWEGKWGYDIQISGVVLDHILDDKKTRGYSRIRYWGKLE